MPSLFRTKFSRNDLQCQPQISLVDSVNWGIPVSPVSQMAVSMRMPFCHKETEPPVDDRDASSRVVEEHVPGPKIGVDQPFLSQGGHKLFEPWPQQIRWRTQIHLPKESARSGYADNCTTYDFGDPCGVMQPVLDDADALVVL